MNFFFNAKDQNGTLVQGTIDAPSEEQAVNLLQQKNLFIISLEEIERGIAKKDLLDFFNKPKRKDVVVFTRQLATLIGADVPLLEALVTLSSQTDKDSFKKVINTVVASVEGGASLSLALSEHSDVFDKFYVNLVKVGEASGKMQETLNYLADYLEHNAELVKKIRGALMYPAFVVGLMIVVVAFLMTSVVPQLLAAVVQSGVTELPLATRILLAVSSAFTKFGALTLIFVAAFSVAIYYYLQSPDGKYRFDHLKISIPRFGKIVLSFYLSRIAETLSTLIKSGVPILESLAITADVVGNQFFEGVLTEAKISVQGGGTISGKLKEYAEIPRLMTSMLETGEKTGRTADMLDNVNKFYKGEADNSIQNLTQIIEPLLMVVLGVGVAIIVAAVLLPIFSMVNAN